MRFDLPFLKNKPFRSRDPNLQTLFTPAAEGHGLWPWMNAPSFGRPAPRSDGGCRPTGASMRNPGPCPWGLTHGQVYDLVERSAIRDDEPMKLRARMNITVYPIIGSDRVWMWVCENYLATESGINGCLHKTPQEIFSI